MRRFYDHLMSRRSIRGPGFLIQSVLLVILISFLAISPLFAQSTAEVCLETRKVLEQYAREGAEVRRTQAFIEGEDRFRTILSDLNKGIANGTVKIQNRDITFLAHYLGLKAPTLTIRETLAFQTEVRPLVIRGLQEASATTLDDLAPRLERIQQQIAVRSRRLAALNCSDGTDAGPVSAGIAGQWTFDRWIYEIKETGPTTFSWEITNDKVYAETATGKYLPQNRLEATWTNKNGTDTGKATIIYDERGRAVRLKFDNGGNFVRKAN